MTHLIRNGSLMIVGIFAATLFGGVAQAEPMIAQNEPAQQDDTTHYHVHAVEVEPVAVVQISTEPDFEGEVTYDKGDLGTWIREGRRVTRVYESDAMAQPGIDDPMKERRTVDHIKHIHHYPADR